MNKAGMSEVDPDELSSLKDIGRSALAAAADA